ncbi:putative ribosome-binding factor A, mitochondrial [Cydia strobilella]|uniref:putative ribosome-binding factor A, mitochondrial n=1 Tax=Cydia strobilella TaxID=1100964 RepID=UPI003003BB6E
MLRRFYHVSCVAFNVKKQGMKLCKMINPKAKKQFFPATFDDKSNSLPSVKSLTKVKHEPGKRGERRMAMLNKMFMKNITDLMSTGTLAMNVVGRGIEISKVKVTPDFQTVNVFWVCKGDSTDEETEEVLNKVAGPLRAELSSLRVMGVVPYIHFIKDRQEAQLVDLDRRLASADYGEDYEPTDLGHLLRTEFILNTKLSPEMKAKIKQVEDQLPIEEEIIPEMTNNVYGLDHAKIMSRLLAARKKSADAWRNVDVDNNVISYRTPADKPVDEESGNQKQELASFLLKRQIQQNKLHKELRNAHDNVVLDDRERNIHEEEYWTDDEQYEEYDDDSFYEELRRSEQDPR